MKKLVLRDILVSVAGVASIILCWHTFVLYSSVPQYLLPLPQTVFQSLILDSHILLPALSRTAVNTFYALVVSALAGGGIAILVGSSRLIELFVSPVLIFLQVTPIVAIAPIILVYAPGERSAQLMCASLVSFFPILANTLQGLKGVDRDQADTLRLYTASKWKMLIVLQMPSALPNLFAGLKIGGGLALVGTVVAEFAAGSAGANSGLAFRLLEAQYRLNTPRLFAALGLLTVLGATIFVVLSCLDRIVLRHWYASRASR